MYALISDKQRLRLLANGRESLQNPDFDLAPVLKLFTPDVGVTWLLTEIDPEERDRAFGLCDLGLGFPELGWVSLWELATVCGRLGLPIKRDLSFQAEKRMRAHARDMLQRNIGLLQRGQSSLRTFSKKSWPTSMRSEAWRCRIFRATSGEAWSVKSRM